MYIHNNFIETKYYQEWMKEESLPLSYMPVDGSELRC